MGNSITEVFLEVVVKGGGRREKPAENPKSAGFGTTC